jgi:hypothetical protein
VGSLAWGEHYASFVLAQKKTNFFLLLFKRFFLSKKSNPKKGAKPTNQ